MDKKKQKALESKGYKFGSAGDFLGLSKEETEYIELKLALSQVLSKQRKQKKFTIQANQEWQKWKKETQPFLWISWLNHYLLQAPPKKALPKQSIKTSACGNSIESIREGVIEEAHCVRT